MSLLDLLVPGKRRMEQKATSPYRVGVRYEFNNGRLVTPADNKQSYITEGYNKNDIIYSVINMILDKVRLPEWGLYKVVDESSLKEYQKIMQRKNISGKDYKKAMQLKYQALEPLSKYDLQAGKLNDLLKYANEYCTFQDFVTYGSQYKLLTGDTFIWGDILSAGANKGIPNELWVLPSQFMNIKVTNDFPVRASSYELTVWNKPFTKESILHEMYDNPNWDFNGQQLYGFAPLRAFLKNINRNNSAKDASAAKFQNGGLDAIIYMDDSRFSAEEGLEQAQALKIKLAEEYTGPTNLGKRAISGIKAGVAELGSTPVELGIIDSEKWDAIMFCNGYGVPPELLGLTQKTYNNVKEAEKALTTRSAIPLLNSRRNSLNRKFQTDWGFKGKNIYLDYETDCFPELQVDIKEAMEAISLLTMRTPNEEREAINWETRPEPEADEVWVKTSSGMQPLSDYQASVVDAALQASINATNGQTNNQNASNGNAGNNNGNTNSNGSSANGQGNRANGKERIPAGS